MRQSRRPQAGLGAAIRQLRVKRDLTQEVLADKAGITVRALSQIETGNANPTWATVRDIAAAVGASVGEVARLSERLEK
ncbi:MAG TPA: helix-turn-helix transcriptional regulator [Solirubrobacterales bacterium]|jgi:transcriptional regulator with XRE-family HTH domain|nr:helix-turn-helix transcriptional regulator [Solirubrobacterales bacterium]